MGPDTRARTNGQLPDLFTDDRWPRLAGRLCLTPRQGQIARLICRGRTNRQIATELRISPDTVRMHLRGLFERLEIHERVGVVVRLVLADREMSP